MRLEPKRKVVAYAVVASAVIVDLPCAKASCTPQKDSNLACPTSTITDVYYKPTENREVQVYRRKIVESKNSQHLAQNGQHEVNITEAYSEYYRSTFIDMLMQISSLYDGHLGQIGIAKHRIKMLPN